MVINVTDCAYNIYTKVYTLTFDAHDIENGVTFEDQIFLSPKSAASAQNVQYEIEKHIASSREKKIHDWTGMTWNSVSL